MRKITLLSIALIFAISQSFGQYFTVKLGGGYAFPGIQQGTGVLTFQPGSDPDPANSAIIPLQAYNTTTHDSLNTRYKKNVYSGYGRGGHFDFSFGYMINPYFGIQLDGAYLWGSNVSATQIYDAAGVLGANAKIVTTTHSNGLSINPSVYLRAAKPGAKVAPYARIGLALPIAGAIFHKLEITAPNSQLGNITSSEIDVKTEAALSLGFQGAVGVSYTPIPVISVWAELTGQYLFVKAKQSTLTKYDLNIQGAPKTIDLLSGLPTYSRVTNFVDNLDQNSNSTDFKTRNADHSHSGEPGHVNEDQGHDVLRQVANLGSFGITVGVTINMSKKIFQDPLGKKAKAARENAAPVQPVSK